MKLLPTEIALRFPAIYATDGTPEEGRTVIAKFFNPCGSGTWYAIEADALVPPGGGDDPTEEKWIPLARAVAEGRGYDDVKFFGLACIHEPELGYFLLSELAEYRDPRFRVGIERDLYYEGKTLADARKAEALP